MSQCSVGCGQGYSIRNVKCKLGIKVVPDAACKTSKPIKSRQCVEKMFCEWRPELWRHVCCLIYFILNLMPYLNS